MLRSALLSISALLWLSACGTPLDSSAARNIHTIALIAADDPNVVQVHPVDNIAGTPGYMGGAIGYLLAPGGGAEETSNLTDIMSKENVRFGSELTDAVDAALRAAGYKVFRVAIKHSESEKLLDNYNNIKVDADAILDINVSKIGYFDKPFSPYYPTASLEARLVDAKSKNELFWNKYGYGGTSSALRPDRLVTADSKYAVWHREDIAKSPDLAIEGLRAGIAPLANLLRSALEPQKGSF